MNGLVLGLFSHVRHIGLGDDQSTVIGGDAGKVMRRRLD